MTTRKLKAFYGFNDADIEANRQGVLTPRQTERLRVARNSEKQIAKVVGVIGIVIACIAAFFALQAYLSNPRQIPTLQIILVLAAGTFGGLGLMGSMGTTDTTTEDIAGGRVKYHAGYARKESRTVRTRYSTTTYYYVWVGTYNFGSVDEEVFKIFLHSHCYRVYYLPLSGRMVACEMIDIADLDTPPEKLKGAPAGAVDEQIPTQAPSGSLLEKFENAADVSYIVYSLRGNSTRTAAIKYYAESGKPPQIVWQSQGEDPDLLHTEALQRLPKVESHMQNKGWQMVETKDDGSISSEFRRVLKLERRNKA